MPDLPYKIAALLYAFDKDGRVLMLHRHKAPNKDLHSPPGGKLETGLGESPTRCAQREMHEETGLALPLECFRLAGIITERAFGGHTHWMMFLYEVTCPIELASGTPAPGEGILEWHDRNSLEALDLPQTDREVIWPLFWKHRGGFFAAHIECDGPDGSQISWQLEQSLPAPDAPSA